jgi:hypothetical protein
MVSLNALALRLQYGLPPLVQKHLQKHVETVNAIKSLKRRQRYVDFKAKERVAPAL